MEDSGAAAINTSVRSSDRPVLWIRDVRDHLEVFLYENGVMNVLPSPSWKATVGTSMIQASSSARSGVGGSNWHAYVFADGVATN